MRQRNYTWYVQPLDCHSNLAVSMQLPEENFSQEKQQIPNLWSCTEQQARAFWKSKHDSGLALDIYNQEGESEIRKKTKLKAAG